MVHNYGHGGEGISLSWGTAVHAAHIVKQLLGNPGETQSVSMVTRAEDGSTKTLPAFNKQMFSKL